MNRPQKLFAWVAGSMAAARLLFPPWILHSISEDSISADLLEGRPEGFEFIFTPPKPYFNDSLFHIPMLVGIDWTAQAWFFTILAASLGMVLFVLRDAERVDGSISILRAGTIALLASLAIPLPFLGMSPLLLMGLAIFSEKGHGWFAMPIMALAGWMAYAVFVWLTIWMFRRVRHQAVVIVIALSAIHIMGFVTPVLSGRHKHSEQERIRENHLHALDSIDAINTSLRQFRSLHGQYPDDLVELGADIANKRAAAGIYLFTYRHTNDGHDGYQLNVDSASNDWSDSDGVRFFSNEEGAIRSCFMCPHANAKDKLASPRSEYERK